MGAVKNINDVIGPAIIGMDATNQFEIDNAMLNICEDAKVTLGGNAVAAVSAAALKAGAKVLDIPLYQHIGGANAIVSARTRRTRHGRQRALRRRRDHARCQANLFVHVLWL